MFFSTATGTDKAEVVGSCCRDSVCLDVGSITLSPMFSNLTTTKHVFCSVSGAPSLHCEEVPIPFGYILHWLVEYHPERIVRPQLYCRAQNSPAHNSSPKRLILRAQLRRLVATLIQAVYRGYRSRLRVSISARHFWPSMRSGQSLAVRLLRQCLLFDDLR